MQICRNYKPLWGRAVGRPSKRWTKIWVLLSTKLIWRIRKSKGNTQQQIPLVPKSATSIVLFYTISRIFLAFPIKNEFKDCWVVDILSVQGSLRLFSYSDLKKSSVLLTFSLRGLVLLWKYFPGSWIYYRYFKTHGISVYLQSVSSYWNGLEIFGKIWYLYI